MLDPDQVRFYQQHGFLHLPDVFGTDELRALRADLDWVIDAWAERSMGWNGPWRQAYMDAETERRSELIAMHDLQFYSAHWLRAVTKPALSEAMSQLLDGPVELHHSTLHVKPPEAGQPFPLHQDWAFYQHADGRYVDVLVHLDDTCHDNGEIRFLDGSHRQGPLRHITQHEGQSCTPHLPTDRYPLTDTVAVPARAGDVVCFNINTVHGSHINQTSKLRRLVRVGYRHPDNVQLGGQSLGRPGLMVWERRPRAEGQPLLPIEGPESRTG